VGNDVFSRRRFPVSKKAHDPMRFVFPPIKIGVPVSSWAERERPYQTLVFAVADVFFDKRYCRSIWRAPDYIYRAIFRKPVKVFCAKPASPHKERATINRARGFVFFLPMKAIVPWAHSVPVNFGFRTVFNFASHDMTFGLHAGNVKP
jgi:hypothetical protein